MDIVYLTTWVRYSILQIILVAGENGFTSKQLIFFLSPPGRLVEQPLTVPKHSFEYGETGQV